MDIAKFNIEWLQAWTDKDSNRLVNDFYAPDVIYKDGQVPAGVVGSDQLRSYLDGLFRATPPMRYDPDEVWALEGGFAGRWICTMDLPDGSQRYLRGFDLVLLRDGKIALNEVYTHSLPARPE